MKNQSFRGIISKGPALIVIIIVVIAVVLSIASYLSYNYSATNVENSAIRSIHVSAQNEVSEMSDLVASKLQLVANNLAILSDAKSVRAGNVSTASNLFQAAQSTTSDLTYAYGWVNQTGAVLYSTNATVLIQAQQQDVNASQDPFFIGAKQSGTTYFSTSFVSTVTGKEIISVARPIYSSEVVNGQPVKMFTGIVSASILLASLGRFFVTQLPSSMSNAGLVDPNGVILYAKDEALIGSNVFGSQFQSLLPTYLKGPFNTMLNESLKGQTGYVDFRNHGVNITLAYEPIYSPKVPAQNTSDPSEFAVLFVGATGILGAAQLAQINFQRDVSILTILGIAAAAVVASTITVRRNKRLDDLVLEKTAALANSNAQLNLELAKEEVLLDKERRSRKEAELLQDILAHDLRNYNQITKTSAELLATDPSIVNTENISLVNAVLDAVDSSSELIERAKKLGKILSEEKPQLQDVNLAHAIERSLDLVKKANKDKSIATTLKVNHDAYALADDLLDEAFTNIFSNSVKYTESENVPIEVDVVEDPNPFHLNGDDSGISLNENNNNKNTSYWKISITDHGRGMSDQVKSKVFTRYLESAHGTGLGLSIVYALVVERYSGRVEVKDRVPDNSSQGTVVTLWLMKKV